MSRLDEAAGRDAVWGRNLGDTENGIARTQDLRLVAPVLRLHGAGTVDLPRQATDLRITPKLASTLQGQGATGEPTFEAGIPFLPQAPMSRPSCAST